ncbi:MAG TPA: AAA family ATPase [Candidatus Binatia bacterium]|nr:AAA family ATPase [Candidatus Binatia bacterium]
MASGGERPFVGRDEALREIARHLAAAEDGSGRVVLVLGEAGVGKTRLVERAIAELPAESVAWGRCHEGGAPAFWPWREALARLAGTLPAEALERARGAGAGEIARIVPAIAADGAPGTAGAPVVPDTVEARFRLFDAVASFLRAAAGSVPLAIVLDDLHWADRESFLLLRFLAPEIRRARVIVLATAREEEMREAAGVPHLLGDLVRIAERVPLAGLTPGDVRDYARAAAGRGVADAVVDAIHRATSGNAFFVTELVDLLDRSGLLDASRIDVERLALPVGVRDAVLRRLENLPPDARRALDVAAVAGREIDVAVLAHVLGVGPEAALACATPAFERRVLTDDGLAPGRVRFVHELVADALRAQLSPDALRATHLALADAFEARAVGAREEIEGEIARHLLAAAPLAALERAVAHAARAGDLALRRLGYEEAAEHYGRAVEAAEGAAIDARARLDLLLRLATARLAASDDDGARGAAVDAAELARELGDVRAMARAAGIASGARSETGQPDHAVIGLLEQAARAVRADDPTALPLVLPPLARELYFVDRDRRLAISDEALRLARAAGDPTALASALGARHLALWEPGTAGERLALATEQIALAEAHDEFQIAMHGHAWRIADLLELGDVDAADDGLVRYEALAERRRLPRLLWHVAIARTSRALRLGRLDEAERSASRALGLWTPGPQNNVLQFYAIHFFLIREEQARLGELDAQLRAFAESSTVPAWQAALASLHATLGRRDDARRVMRDMAARGFDALPFDGTWLATMARLALACAAIGEREIAAELLPRLAPYARYDVVIGAGVACLGSAERFVGLLALAAGRADEAVAHLTAAVDANGRQRAHAQTAHARAELARALREAGDAAAAAELEAQALDDARRLRMVALERAIESEARARPARAAGRSGDAAGRDRSDAPVRAVLRRDGDVWHVAHGDESTCVRDMKGMAYLAFLVGNAGREFHALDVGGHDAGTPQHADEVLDAEARRAFRDRLAELREELQEAESFNDIGRADRLRDEMEALAGELTRATGLRGRDRRAGTLAERARLNVTRAVRKAIAHVAEGCPRLGHHLSKSVETGRLCCYREDPTFPLVWEL